MIKPFIALFLVAACGGSQAPTKPAGPPEKSVQLNAPGAPVNIDTMLVPGYVTVVDFWSDTCGACVIAGGRLAVSVAQSDTVLIRKVDVGDGFTEVAKAYDVGALPHLRVYDQQGKLRYALVGNDAMEAGEIAKQIAAEPRAK